ncbi:MAG: ABC transporter permease [Lachnospiraceae bacterium]|nr:ABC transporter permease [Lachnospiraceae bacterium]
MADNTSAKKASGNSFLKKLWSSQVFKVYLIMILLYVAACIVQPNYLSWDYINTLALMASILGIIAIGQTMVILTGGIDMTIQYSLTLGVCLITAFDQDGKTIQGMILAVVICTIIGFINGLGISLIGIPAIIMTNAMNYILKSVVNLYTTGTPRGVAPVAWKNFILTSYLGIKGGVWFWGLLAAIAIFLISKTNYGRKLVAIGANRSVANYSGINTKRVLISVYTLSGMFIGFASWVAIGYRGRPFLSVGDGYDLMSVASVVLGATSIMGGKGNYTGTIAGCLILQIVTALLTTIQIEEAGKKVIYGVIILVVLLVYSLSERKKKR